MKKRVLSILLAALMVVSLLPTVALATETAGLDNFEKVQTYTDGKFTDVKADDWFEKNVSSAYELNIMVGRRNDFFDTDNYLTVAEAMTIAARLRSIYYTGKAEFEQGKPWYQAYADYCKANGVADPADYDMNKAITRGEFAEIFAKALPADALKKINTVQDNMIPDVKKADKFSAAIYLLYRAGVLVGNDAKGTFAPDTNIKRVEVAAITTRMAQPALRESIRIVKPSSGGGSYTPPAPTTYTVTFDMQGHGTQIDPITNVASNAKITAPPAPSAAGWKFKGWYIDSDCATEWKFDTNTVAKNTILYAKWVETVGYVIGNNFPTKDVVWTNGNSSTCYYEPFLVALTPSLVFSKTEPNGYASVYLVNEVTKVTDGYTYRDDNRKFTITFNMNEGELVSIVFDAEDEAIDQIKAVEGTYTAPTPATTYTVTFNMQELGEQITAISNVPYGSTIQAPTAPTATGYTFGGWYKESECTHAWDFDTDTVTGDTTLYAKWTAWSTIADILATVVIPSVAYHSGPGSYDVPEGAWVCDNGESKAFIVWNTSNANSILRVQDETYAYIPLATSVGKTDDSTFSATFGNNTFTFTIESDKLASFTFNTTATDQTNVGTYKPALATLTMKKAGDTEEDWNKITITIKGNNITSGSYTFGKVGDNSLASIELTDEEIESVNSTEGLPIYKNGLDAETTYKIIFIVLNSANDSQTIETTYQIGEAPPP